ncbi:YgaP family membrane protein [Anoxybacillus eryuanensis]|uniref:YgaP family membrane protein n=1 Tax=Anoxybacillus eryuanensis TaxID=651866 RepID=UPI003EF94A9C
MKANVGSVDRMIRFILGIALLGLFFLEGNIKYVGILGVVLIATAFIRFCPLYVPFRISTTKK